MKQRNDAPDSAEIAELLHTRHEIRGTVLVKLTRADGRARARVTIDQKKPAWTDRYLLEVVAQKGGASWDSVVNATDALVGMLVESDYAHRDLPAGEDVEHEGSKFSVRVEYSRPELETCASSLLAGSDDPLTPQ